jgi:hypothetical protein
MTASSVSRNRERQGRELVAGYAPSWAAPPVVDISTLSGKAPEQRQRCPNVIPTLDRVGTPKERAGPDRTDTGRARGSSDQHDASRAATTRPARQPGARPGRGGWIPPASIPARVSNHEITEFEFHISPVWCSSRPQTSGGTDGTKSRTCEARARSSATRTGLATASATSGMTPSRHRRTSYRKTRKRPASLVPTAPSTTAPCWLPSARATGVCSMTKRPSGTTTTRAEW